MRNLFSKKLSLIVLASGLGTWTAATQAAAQSFTIPAAATSSQTKPYTGLSAAVSIAVDANGNLFYSQPNSQTLVEQPASGGSPIVLYTETGNGTYPKGVATNGTYAYITDYGGHLWQVPVGGGTAVDLVNPGCNSVDSYYLGTYDVATDGQGNVYTVGGQSSLFKINSAGVCSTVAGVTLDGSTSLVAVDAAGDIAYSNGGVLCSLPVGATAAVAVSASFNSIVGLRADASGNVFVTTYSGIIEVPFINGALSGANAFAVVAGSSAGDVAVGADGTIYTTDGSNIYKNLIGNVQFGTATVGASAGTQTVNVVFNAAETLTGIRLASGTGTSSEITNANSGTCATNYAYTVGATCTIALSFTPSEIGARNGAVVLSSATGVVGEVSVGARGSGPGLVVDPGTQVALGSGWTSPSGVAVDASGSAVVSDKAAGTVSYVSAGNTTATTIATGLTQPSGVAVDADGNVFVANTGANTVVEIPFTGASFGTAAAVVSGLNGPSALAFGRDGSLYIANKNAGTVLRVPNQAGLLNFYDKVAVGGTFTAPSGLATDATGNIYVVDSSAGNITEISGATTSVVASGLNAPLALAVDDSGSLYVVESGVATVTRIAYSGGAYNSNATTSLGNGFMSLVGVAASGAGNLYVTDATGAAVTSIERVAGLLNFGNVNEQLSSATQSVALSNDGDTTLTFGATLYTASGNTTDYTVSSPATNPCAASGTLAAGAACGISGVFSPTTTGTRAETLTLASNAVNASPVTATLTGFGTNLPKTTLGLTTTPNGTVSYGTSVSATATITLPAGSTTAATGTVTFFVNGTSYATVNVANGSASTTITGLAAQQNTIGATYSGDTNYAGSTATEATITVNLASTATSFTSSVSSVTPVPPNTSVTFTSTVTSAVTSSKPSGTVNFVSNGVTLVSAAVNSTTGIATVTTTALPTGTYAVTAVYSGDSGFATSSSTPITISILSAGFVVANLPTALTVTAPGSVSTTFAVHPISGYVGGVDMSCSGLPANTQCTFLPAVLAFNGTNLAPQNVTLTITTDQAPPTTVATLLLPFGALLMLMAWRKRKTFIRGLAPMAVLLVLGLVGLASLNGCGSSNSPKTPGGTSTVTVTFVGSASGTTTVPTSGSGNLTQSATFSLTVK